MNKERKARAKRAREAKQAFMFWAGVRSLFHRLTKDLLNQHLDLYCFLLCYFLCIVPFSSNPLGPLLIFRLTLRHQEIIPCHRVLFQHPILINKGTISSANTTTERLWSLAEWEVKAVFRPFATRCFPHATRQCCGSVRRPQQSCWAFCIELLLLINSRHSYCHGWNLWRKIVRASSFAQYFQGQSLPYGMHLSLCEVEWLVRQ